MGILLTQHVARMRKIAKKPTKPAPAKSAPAKPVAATSSKPVAAKAASKAKARAGASLKQFWKERKVNPKTGKKMPIKKGELKKFLNSK